MQVFFDKDEWYSYHSLVTRDALEQRAEENPDDPWYTEQIAECVEVPDELWAKYIAARDNYTRVLEEIAKYDE